MTKRCDGWGVGAKNPEGDIFYVFPSLYGGRGH